MGRYVHAICWQCWGERHPGQSHPLRDCTGPVEACCFCGQLTLSGIYVRADPEGLRCGGEHGEEAPPPGEVAGGQD